MPARTRCMMPLYHAYQSAHRHSCESRSVSRLSGHAASVGAERYAFLGDLIGYGADPVWVLDTIASYCAGSAICVLGNHDEAVLAEPRGSMRPDAQEALTWTRARLHAAHFTFLRQLPLHVEVEDMLFVHANALAPERWEYHSSRRSMHATAWQQRSAVTRFVATSMSHTFITWETTARRQRSRPCPKRLFG